MQLPLVSKLAMPHHAYSTPSGAESASESSAESPGTESTTCPSERDPCDDESEDDEDL